MFQNTTPSFKITLNTFQIFNTDASSIHSSYFLKYEDYKTVKRNYIIFFKD
ncbi:hypothetical protein HNP38_002849 [Chryseobacterium defluvii]|uniref:Uncharacterized protein n=1 Tax=Chryseobacterium defluvii TaxID=160396 RepID=A0A840KJ62_9FLAO|nr:hypothetical protein [Chryseobacterium defluvii]